MDVRADGSDEDRQKFYQDYYDNRDDPDKDVKKWESWNENIRDRDEETSRDDRIVCDNE